MDNKWLDPVVQAYQEHFADTAEIVFDVGTRDGDDAEFFREKLDAKRVIAIDANPAAAEATRLAYPTFEVIETAVSNYTGTVKFLQVNSDNKDWAGTSSMDLSKAWREAVFEGITEVIEVPVVTLSDLIDDLGLSSSLIDVMKIDVESYTYEALLGLGEAIRQVKVYHLETERRYNRPGHGNNMQIAALMRHFGFYLYNVSYEWGDNIQDQVWVNKALATVAPYGYEILEQN